MASNNAIGIHFIAFAEKEGMLSVLLIAKQILHRTAGDGVFFTKNRPVG
jgi:hypothetical protein